MREKVQAKLGTELSRDRGQAKLWLLSEAEKREELGVLTDLSLVEDASVSPDPTLTFSLPMDSPDIGELANFRNGDMVLLFPDVHAAQKGEILQYTKASIVRLSGRTITLSLRHAQIRRSYFDSFDTWRIEPDVLDNSYEHQLRYLVRAFAELPSARLDVLLGHAIPEEGSKAIAFEWPSSAARLSEAQRATMGQIIDAPGYFLLQGPPGSGKTSLILRTLVEGYLHAGTTMLLLAYTNRAVDEICDQLAGLKVDALRIGSRLGTAPEHQHLLLNARVKARRSRKAIHQLLTDVPIVVGTVASLLTKMELLQMKRFDIAIVDEASQILEPTILPVLAKVEKHILIGDQMQLPAVVAQPASECIIAEPELHDIGLRKTSESYFERMFRRCEALQADTHVGRLLEQGRMHEDISTIVERLCYPHGLLTAGLSHQTGKASAIEALDRLICPGCSSNRVMFIDIRDNGGNVAQRQSEPEARLASQIAETIAAFYGPQFNPDTDLGVISPFRNQLSLIRQTLNQLDTVNGDQIWADTVERYQGSQREVIIFSAAVKTVSHLRFLRAEDPDGPDRKLNVTLSRAKARIFLLGNAALLSELDSYRQVIEYCKTSQAFVQMTPEEISGTQLMNVSD
jgi:DNA replication ATP-dependent helicase Dna2